jgi:RimJ/RimL family protein N-acetyltransferase
MIVEQTDLPRVSYRLIARSMDDFSLIGFVSLKKIEKDFLPDIGISLNPSHQGKGLGTELYRGLISFAFKSFPAQNAVQAVLNPANIPSLRLHFKCGMNPFCFTKDGFVDGGVVEDDLSIRITREHFEKHGAHKVLPSFDNF